MSFTLFTVFISLKGNLLSCLESSHGEPKPCGKDQRGIPVSSQTGTRAPGLAAHEQWNLASPRKVSTASVPLPRVPSSHTADSQHSIASSGETLRCRAQLHHAESSECRNFEKVTVDSFQLLSLGIVSTSEFRDHTVRNDYCSIFKYWNYFSSFMLSWKLVLAVLKICYKCRWNARIWGPISCIQKFHSLWEKKPYWQLPAPLSSSVPSEDARIRQHFCNWHALPVSPPQSLWVGGLSAHWSLLVCLSDTK